jgi:hypothetical protein
MLEFRGGVDLARVQGNERCQSTPPFGGKDPLVLWETTFIGLQIVGDAYYINRTVYTHSSRYVPLMA